MFFGANSLADLVEAIELRVSGSLLGEEVEDVIVVQSRLTELVSRNAEGARRCFPSLRLARGARRRRRTRDPNRTCHVGGQ